MSHEGLNEHEKRSWFLVDDTIQVVKMAWNFGDTHECFERLAETDPKNYGKIRNKRNEKAPKKIRTEFKGIATNNNPENNEQHSDANIITQPKWMM